MSLLEKPKTKKIQDYQTKRTLRTGLDDFAPYEITLPDPPPFEQIINYGLPVEEQFFRFEEIPAWVWQLSKAAKTKGRQYAVDIVENNPDYANFISSQWDKRLNGIFIFIYGQPLWIPGPMWYFLNYYKMNQHTEFRFVDLEYWWWKVILVYGSPNVYGGLEFTQRRDGKSYRACSDILERTTRSEMHFSGIQSKTNEDAKSLFQRGIILPWHKLPFYFQPIFDSKAYPVKEINFRDAQRDTERFESGELNSWIEARPTVYTAFDGEPLTDYLLDEAGKIQEMLASDCWRVVKQCLRERTRIKGRAMLTTTVEETTKGGLKEWIALWDASDINRKTKLGQTESGLLPFFKPAWQTFIFDQYGHSIIEEPDDQQAEFIKQQMIEAGDKEGVKLNLHRMGGRERVDHEISSQKTGMLRQQTIRMYPRSIREAFRTDAKNCHFTIEIINSRLEYYRFGNPDVVGVRLNWRNGQSDTVVDYREVAFENNTDLNGIVFFKKGLWEYIKTIANNVYIREGWRFPGNSKLGIIACDPYKQDGVEDEKRRSLGTAHGYLLHNPEIDAHTDTANWLTEDLFMEVGFRGTVDQYDELMMMIATFTGMKFSPEMNSGDVAPQFVRRRYDKFLYYESKPKKEGGIIVMKQNQNPGFHTLGENFKVPLFNEVDEHIDRHGHRMVFPRFLENCRDVEIKNLSPYDFFVSGGNAIRLGRKIAAKRVDKASMFTCERHPDVRVNADGECPKCGRRLEKEKDMGFTGFWQPAVVG